MKNELSFKQSMILNKHALLLFANLDEKLNTTEIKLLSYALLKINFSKDKIMSKFSISEFKEFSEVKRLRKNALTENLLNIRKSGFTFFNESFYSTDDFENGQEWHSLNIISNAVIKDDFIYIEWINSELHKKILRGVTESNLLIDLSITRKLSDRAWILYEILKLLSVKKIHNIRFDLETFSNIYKVSGKNRTSYKYLNGRYVVPIIQEINEKTEYNIQNERVIQGKKSIGISLSWSIDKPEYMITDSQKDTLLSLNVDYEKYNLYYLDDPEYQSIRKSIKIIDELTSHNAGKLIAIALAKMKQVRKNILQQEKKSFALLEVNPYESYFELWKTKIKNQEKVDFINLIEQFQEKEKVAKYVFEIAEEQNAESFTYILTCLKDWLERSYLTVREIENYYLNLKFKVDDSILDISDDFLSAMDLWRD